MRSTTNCAGTSTSRCFPNNHVRSRTAVEMTTDGEAVTGDHLRGVNFPVLHENRPNVSEKRGALTPGVTCAMKICGDV